MDNIKIVRLQNGEDLIGSVLSNDYDEYYITDPMFVAIEYFGNKAHLIMRQWLPSQLIKGKEVKIKERDILFITEPDDSFSQYYIDTVEKLADLVDYKEKTKDMGEEEINTIMDAYEEINQGIIIH
jgi:hypothetical protein